MSSRTVHTVAAGDTFESLSTRYYGEPSQSGRIRSQNPGVAGVLVPGTTVTILGANETTTAGVEPEGLTMKIAGVNFKHWTKTVITRAMDEVSTVAIETPYADTPEFRELIRPLSFADLDVSVDGVRLFRGTMVNVNPRVTPEGSLVNISGYSLPGVLGDCMLPASAYPLQFRKMGIADIADKIASPLGITVVREGNMGGPFRRVKLKRDRLAMSFLTKLAQDRGLLIRSNPSGELVIAEPPPLSAPVASLNEDDTPLMRVDARFSPQRYFSHVTGVRNSGRKRRGTQQTIQNARAIEAGIVRPFTITLRNISKGELPAAAKAAAGRMLAGSVAYIASVPTWEDSSGNIWEPGTTIEITAPRAFIPTAYQFQIRKVRLERTIDGTTAQLALVLPGAFGGEPPDVLPWQQ